MQVDHQMQKTLRIIFLFFSFAGISLAIWSFIIELNRLVVRNYELKVSNWSPKLNDFKIVAISDIHGGSNFVDEAKIRQIVIEANVQNPDIIVLLGDYISEEAFNHTKLKMPMEVIAENLKGLQAKYGVYAIMGNHNEGYDSQIIRRELERIGCRVLEDEAISIKKDGDEIRLLGVVDGLLHGSWSQNNTAAKSALSKLASKSGKIIILTHNPNALNYLTEQQSVDPEVVLFLAGHTHGGQVRFPIIGAPLVPTEFGQKYASGFVRDKGIDIFITPGIGTSIIPVRFGVPPEISVLNITAE